MYFAPTFWQLLWFLITGPKAPKPKAFSPGLAIFEELERTKEQAQQGAYERGYADGLRYALSVLGGR